MNWLKDVHSCIYCMKVMTQEEFKSQLTTGTSDPFLLFLRSGTSVFISAVTVLTLNTLEGHAISSSWWMINKKLWMKHHWTITQNTITWWSPPFTFNVVHMALSISLKLYCVPQAVLMFLMTFTNLFFSLPQLFWILAWGTFLRVCVYKHLVLGIFKSLFNAWLFISVWMSPLWPSAYKTV